MAGLQIDLEALSDGLEKGIESVDGLVSVEKSLRLRMPYCGVASVAVADYLESQGHRTELVISRPNLEFDPSLGHVMVGVNEQIIDSTYSQFLEFVGLTPGYVYHAERDDYPGERIVMFEKTKSARIARALATHALQFRKLNSHPETSYGMTLGHGPLERASEQQLVEAYGAIWNSSNFQTFRPSKQVIAIGRAISAVVGDHLRYA